MSEIIGAGLCRTGTSSTLVALERLEIGPVYHMKEVMERNLGDKVGFFIAIYSQESSDWWSNQMKETSKVDGLHRWK